MSKHLRVLSGVFLLFIIAFTMLLVSPAAVAMTSRSTKKTSTATSQHKHAKIRSGENVYTILKRHGFNDQQRKTVIEQSGIPKNFVLSPGDLYWLKKTNPHSVEITFFDLFSPNAYVFQRNSQTNEKGQKVALNYTVRKRTDKGVIRGSLIESIRQVTGDEMLAYRLMDAYHLDYNITKDLQRGAKFEITYEQLFYNNQFIRNGDVLRTALEFNGRPVLRTYRDLKSGGGVFIDHDMSLSNRRFFAPVDQIRISSLFQKRRYHPIKKYKRAHEGVDFELPVGEPVYAIADAVVLRSGRNRAAGRYVVLRHAGGYESYYNHLHWLKNLSPGQSVRAGAKIGEIGCSGYCTKPHLHFAIKKSGQFVNPVYLIRNYSFHQRNEVTNLVATNKL